MNFNLKDTKAEITAIVVWLSYPTRWKYYPGLSITPSQWDKAKQRAKPQHPNRVMMNRLLDKIEKSIYDMWLQAVEADTHLSHEQIKHKLDILLQKKEDTTNKLIPFIDMFIKQSGKKPNTVKMYRVVRNRLKDYNPNLTFDDITLDWFYGFVESLKKDYKPNTIWGTIKNLKVFMQDSYDRGLHTNIAFQHKKFSSPKVQTENIYLPESDLEKLFRYKYDNDRLQNAVDLFLVLCWTGLRVSDLTKVNKSNYRNVKGQECFVIETEKTGAVVMIPMHPMLKSILNKYDFSLRFIEGQNINDYIKEAGKIAKVDQFEKISTRVARISMACNLYLDDVPEQTIMQIMGWKKTSTMMIYLKRLSKSDHLEKVSKIWQNKKGYLKAI